MEEYDWPTPGIHKLSGNLVHTFEDAFLGLDDCGTFLEKSIIFSAIATRHPAIQDEGNTPIGWDPFAIVAPGEMQVSGI